MTTRPHVAVFDLEELRRGPTAWLFEGGEEPLLVVSVHESASLEQTFLGREPAQAA